MRLDWIFLNPAGPYVALAIGLTLCLFLFFTVKRDLRAGEARWRAKVAALEAGFDAKGAAFDERLVELSHISGLLVPPVAPRSGLNLTKRSQVLRMHRRGADSAEIAAALSLPQNEVDLLVKVQNIVLSNQHAPATRTAGS